MRCGETARSPASPTDPGRGIAPAPGLPSPILLRFADGLTGKTVINGDGALNIKARSLRLGDFGPEEMERLLAQHTAEPGLAFLPEALDAVGEISCGRDARRMQDHRLRDVTPT